MRFGSICSGIEAASVAWHPLGWEAAFLSEIEPFPRSVLSHHYPDVPLRGDFTTIGGNDHGTIDLLVGGTPCQSFSVAGLRKGLADDRGNLALEYLRLADRTRPRWLVWENVPGVLSSNGGRDFGAFLGGLGELGYGWAYRVLDAQFVRVESHPRAVPQRRRRVFVVGYLGDWRRAAAVLFERESLSGHPAPRREAGQGSAGRVARSVAIRGRDGTPQAELGEDVANAVLTPNGGRAGVGVGAVLTQDVAHSLRGRCFDASEDGTGRGTPLVSEVAPTISARPTGGGGLGTDFDCDGRLIASTGPVSHCLNAGGMGRIDYESETLLAFSCKDHGADASAGAAPTLRAMGHDGSHANAGGQLAVAFNHQTGGDFRPMVSEECANALQRHQGQAVAFDPNQITSKANRSQPRGDVLHTMPGTANPPHIASPAAVRRLTPLECEFLQGFPGDYTLVPHRGKPAADGPRYKALGNSMAVNVMSWIGERIAMVDEL